MTNEVNEIGRFLFGISLLQDENGEIEPQTEILSKNVPPEIIIMLLKSFLKNAQQEYFGSD